MDPLEQSRAFLDLFDKNVNPFDPLPIPVPAYYLKYDELEPAIVEWVRLYLDQFRCPQCILTPIVRNVVEDVLIKCKENPKDCGLSECQVYKTLQLSRVVISRTNEVCKELLDNEKLNNLLADLAKRNGCLGVDQTDSSAEAVWPAGRKFHFSLGLKHKRRSMEDRHVCLPDFNALFCTKDTEPTAFYGVYDGHGGQEAASYAASHLHYYVAQSEHYPHDMKQAFREAFLKTDELFLEKSKNHFLRSGATAVACVHHIRSRHISVAWAGDSQAILVKRNPGEGIYKQLAHPTHVASDPDERNRIHAEGGMVIAWNGQFRVKGHLAITRAIGNPSYKPYVTAEPAVSLHQCTDDDLLLVLASDGLWEGCNEYYTSMFVLYAIRKFPDDPQRVTDSLITFAKQETGDNITVIIVFLKDPRTIIKETPFIEEIETRAKLRAGQTMDIDGAASNGYLNNAIFMEEQQNTFEDIKNFMSESVLLEPKSAATLCVGPMDDMGFLSDGGLGPETDVDGVHDSKQQSPSPLLEEPVKPSEELDNGDIEHEIANAESVEQHTMDHHNPFAQSLTQQLEVPSEMVNVPTTTDFEEEAPTSPSSVSAADPVDLLSEEQQLVDAVPHVNGNGEHHYDEPNETEDEEQLGAMENEGAEIVPTLKAELNADEIVPLKTIDEPIVNELLGGDAIVDNKLIDQLDSIRIPEAIRRQLIEQQVSGGAAMLHEQDEDDDDGQLIAEEKHSEFDGTDDGAEKEDLHHEKVFDSDYATDHHSADVKQDDDAGCCEDSEEDEWDYVKVSNQQQQEQQQESHPAAEKQPESKYSEEITHTTVEQSNSFYASDDDQLQQQENGDVPLVQEQLEQQFEREEANYEQEVVEQTQPSTVEDEHREEQEEVVEHHDETTAVPNSSELVVVAAAADILGDNTESAVSECTKEVDDVISGAETKEVVNLLNEFREDVPPPAIAADALFETNCINEESTESTPFVPSDSVNMEASMYGGSLSEQPISPESPVSPVDNFPAQHQQQQQFSDEKDMFGTSMDDAMSPAGEGEELKEKHLYETEEKMMNFQQQEESSWQLNPDAKEFVPVTGSSAAGEINAKLHENVKLRDDAIVAQSPRKGTMSSMEDLDVPAETVFQTEMDKRPHEFEAYEGDNGGEHNMADDSAGDHRLRSPAVHPFDLSQFSEQTVVEQQHLQDSNAGDITNGDYVSSDMAGDLVQTANTNGAMYGTDEMELLNKVQQLPVDEETITEAEPQAEPATFVEFDPMAGAAGSAKEELYVEQKETVDASPTTSELVADTMDLMAGEEMQLGYTNPLPSDQIPKSMVSDISQSPEFKMLQSSVDNYNALKNAESSYEGHEPEFANVHKESSALEASVYEPEPDFGSAQQDPPVQQLTSNEQLLQASSGFADLMGVSEPVGAQQQEPLPQEKPLAEVAETQHSEEKVVEETKVTEVETASSGVAAAATVAVATAAAAAAVAATATAASKPSKPKASTTAPAAKKPAASSVSAKPSSAASKDGSAVKSAARVGSTGTTGAARKPPAAADAKKAPTAAKPSVTSSTTMTNGVKERPASATSTKSSLAAKKPTTAADAAKTAPSKTTSATSSVTAARTKVASTTSSSTTKSASASSATRTAVSKSVTSSATTSAAGAGKTSSSRLSTTTTTTRTVTSRPSSAVSSASVPSKTSTTTTTTAKRTVAAKSSLTNGTTTTDGASAAKPTRTTTTASSTVPRTAGATRTTGTTGLAAKSATTTTAAAKKSLDVKSTVTKNSLSATGTATGKPTTTRVSLAPKAATATSPSVRKLQTNGVASKKPAVSPASTGVKKTAAGSKSQPAKVTQQAPSEAAPTTTTTATAIAETNGTVNNESVDVATEVLATSPPEQPADQLLVPVPQAM